MLALNIINRVKHKKEEINRMKNQKWIWVIVVVMLLVTLACGSSSNEGTKVDEKPTAAETTKAPTPTMTVYSIGDVIQVKEHSITLIESKLTENVLQATFLVENHGDSDLNISSLVSFTAKDSEGTKLEQEYFDCGSSSLDGKVLPGDKLRGSICFKGVKPASTVRIYYESSLFGSGATVWELNTSQLGKVEAPAESETDAGEEADEAGGEGEEASSGVSQLATYQVGDVIELDGHTITLNEAAISGRLLKANFTIQNTGASDLSISTILSFYAKDGNGEKLEQNIFDCGSAMLDGSLIPGDTIRGDVCWNVKSDTNIKIYYEASLLGSGAVVWQVPAP